MYNNNFLNYQSYPSYQTYPSYQQQEGINWVRGIDEAKAFPLMPNTMTLLLDRLNDGIFYIKYCDNIGMSQIRKFKYHEIFDETNQKSNQYVTREELEQMLKEIQNEQTIPTANEPNVEPKPNDEYAQANR